jgi:hypothetical protein
MEGRAVTAAAARAKAPRPSPLEVFIARAETRAVLWACGEIDLHEAVDELQAAAERDGLVTVLGQDAVQEIIADAFAPQRDDLPHDVDVVPDPARDEMQAANGEVPKATLEAAEFLVQQRDPARLRSWLDNHTAQERETILQHLEQRKRARAS